MGCVPCLPLWPPLPSHTCLILPHPQQTPVPLTYLTHRHPQVFVSFHPSGKLMPPTLAWVMPLFYVICLGWPSLAFLAKRAPIISILTLFLFSFIAPRILLEGHTNCKKMVASVNGDQRARVGRKCIFSVIITGAVQIISHGHELAFQSKKENPLLSGHVLF